MIEKALAALKIDTLNEMQLQTLEAADKHKDIVLLSPTGSGKTLAFLIPIMTRLKKEVTGVQAMIIAPSRELALQIEQVAKAMSTGFKINCCYGGHSFSVERQSLQPAPSVIIGTPGRLADHIRRETIDTAKIHSLVLDEFDKALEFGFKEDMSFIISEIPNLKRRILTSATSLEEIPEFTGIEEPKFINHIKKEKDSGLKLKQVIAEGTDKTDTLYDLICKIGSHSSIVFCNHREAVDRISVLLRQKGIAHGVFHGGMDQDQREKALIKFRNGSNRLLITTDLASRGLDIPEIRFIIHYQLPPTPEVFTHRNGRTARMNATGTAYLILAKDEYVPRFITEEPELEKLPSKPVKPENPEWETLFIGAGKKDKVNKVDVVGLLLQKGKLNKEDLGLIEVQDFTCYVAVKRNKIQSLLNEIRNEKIKNKKVKIGIAE